MSNVIERTLIKENNKLREELNKSKNRTERNYKYFVSYLYWGENAAGIADNEEIILGKEIKGIEDIRYIQAVLKHKKKLEKVIVISFTLLTII